MIGLFLAAQATLSFPAGIYTYPEIAANLSTPEHRVKCDPEVAHRAAFLATKSILEEDLLETLGLKLQATGEQSLKLRADESVRERRWRTAILDRLQQQLQDFTRGLLEDTFELPAAIPDRHTLAVALLATISDANAKLVDRLAALKNFRFLNANVTTRSLDARALALLLNEVASDFRPELLAQGEQVDTVPFSRLSHPVLALLKSRHKTLVGDADSMLVVRKVLYWSGPTFQVRVKLRIVDSGYIGDLALEAQLPLDLGTLMTSREGSPSLLAELKQADVQKVFRLPGFTEAVTPLTEIDSPAREKLDRLFKEGSRKRYSSLSEVAANWAKKGNSIVMELSPSTEPQISSGGTLTVEKLGDWSIRNSGETLLLSPIFRWLECPRHYPFSGLRALEKCLEREGKEIDPDLFRESIEMCVPEYTTQQTEQARWGRSFYHGIYGSNLDSLVNSYRTIALVPPAALAAVDAERGRFSAIPAAEWEQLQFRPRPAAFEIAVSECDARTQGAILDLMRGSASNDSGSALNDLVYSPRATSAFLQSARLQVKPGRDLRERRYMVSVTSTLPLFSHPGTSLIAGVRGSFVLPKGKNR